MRCRTYAVAVANDSRGTLASVLAAHGDCAPFQPHASRVRDLRAIVRLRKPVARERLPADHTSGTRGQRCVGAAGAALPLLQFPGIPDPIRAPAPALPMYSGGKPPTREPSASRTTI